MINVYTVLRLFTAILIAPKAYRGVINIKDYIKEELLAKQIEITEAQLEGLIKSVENNVAKLEQKIKDNPQQEVLDEIVDEEFVVVEDSETMANLMEKMINENNKERWENMLEELKIKLNKLKQNQ